MDIWGDWLKSSMITFLTEICFQDKMDVAGSISLKISRYGKGPFSRWWYHKHSVTYKTDRKFSASFLIHKHAPSWGGRDKSSLQDSEQSILTGGWQYWEEEAGRSVMAIASATVALQRKPQAHLWPHIKSRFQKMIPPQIQWYSTSEALRFALAPNQLSQYILKRGMDSWCHTKGGLRVDKENAVPLLLVCGGPREAPYQTQRKVRWEAVQTSPAVSYCSLR